MATLTDIAVDIQNKLAAIQVNTGNTEANVLLVKADTAAMVIKLGQLITVNQNGFFNLSQGLAEIIKQEFAANQQLRFNNQQNEIIICWLKTIANVLCDILHRLDASYETEQKIATCLCILKEIQELVHGNEAMEALKHRELKQQIEQCCPPPKPEPKPCFTPCRELPEPPRVPDPGYKPLDPPRDQPTPGTTPGRPNG